MADTNYLKYVVENFVRQKLSEEYKKNFEPKVLKLITGGTHEFDAVSEDGHIVGSIKTAGGKTATGKFPVGKVNTSLAELYYLSLVEAPERMLILTSTEFYEILKRYLTGRLAPGLTLKLITLPEEIQRQVNKIRKKASIEVSKKTEV